MLTATANFMGDLHNVESREDACNKNVFIKR